MNVLPLLKSDFVDDCWKILEKGLKPSHLQFDKKATVCKYIVPKGYPQSPEKGSIKIGKPTNGARIYYAAVESHADSIELTSSRAIAIVGIGENLRQAQEIAQKNCDIIQGPVFYRKDIGTQALIQKRVDHMEKIRNG